MSSTLSLLSFASNDTQGNASQSTTTTATATGDVYDHQGAALYIAVILVWYSTGLAMMLFLQVRPRNLQQQFLFDSSDSSRKNPQQSSSKNPFANYRNIQADSTTKQILNELKDPERRQRLWKIYYASEDQHDEPYPQYYQTITSDGATIDRIKRKLADIHRMDEINADTAIISSNIPSTQVNRSSTIAGFDSTKFFTKRFQSLRRPVGNTTTTATGSTRTSTMEGQESAATMPSNNAIEMEPLVRENPSAVTTTNGSRKRNNLFVNRFTVEKVPSNNPTSSTTNGNISE